MKGKSMVSIGMAECKLGVEGAKAVAELASVTASLTKILVCWNKLGDESTAILCDALRGSKVTKVQELDLSQNDIGPEGAKAVAAMAAVVGSLTRLDVSHNNMGDGGVKLLRDALRERQDQALDLKFEGNEDHDD